ncbi:hypothetical protein FOZ63_003852 [Perkinsus olseni]|uniref:Uncharacterized protein n=1 Tax=Perkinsus olseni TaxID=32597 RepID=A0A7J6T2M3_PEROL|nr:hypothetical protein FOZ62_002916 [Perkinsus olseni]KAF4744284.1 hypothetical protein FOZ63_003852 [Perkinsus olseni]
MSLAEFRVDPGQSKTTATSPMMEADCFNFCVKVYLGQWNLRCGFLGVFTSFHKRTASVDLFPLGHKVKFQVELVNHGNPQASIVIRARAYTVGWGPKPVSPEWHEVRFDGRQEYDPGDEFKSPPTWKGNYKFQVAVLPGGIRSEDGQQYLAAYIHLLGTRDVQISSHMLRERSCRMSIDFRCRRKYRDDRYTVIGTNWTAIHTFDGFGHSWGCPALILISEIKNEALGWLNPKGKIVIRASVSPSLDEGPNPLEFQFRGERSSITTGSARRGAMDTVESSAKRVKKE